MCQRVGSAHLASGWICCECKIYNGDQRPECKQCNRNRCEVEESASSIGSAPNYVIPRERLDSIIADLSELLAIADRLLPKIEAEVERIPFSDLVESLNEIEMPEKASQQFRDLVARLPAIIGVDPAMLRTIMQLNLGSTLQN